MTSNSACLVLFVTLTLVDVMTFTSPSLNWATITSPEETEFLEAIIETFSDLSGTNLTNFWHTNCHRRCRDQLVHHIEIACHYDPYRVSHRQSRSLPSNKTRPTGRFSSNPSRRVPARHKSDSPGPRHSGSFPFITKNSAASFLRRRRSTLNRSKRNIMDECCFHKACTWEEFGEYCQDNPRRSLADAVNACSYS